MRSIYYYSGCVCAVLSGIGTYATYAQSGLSAGLSAAYAVWFGLLAIGFWLSGVGHFIADAQKK